MPELPQDKTPPDPPPAAAGATVISPVESTGTGRTPLDPRRSITGAELQSIIDDPRFLGMHRSESPSWHAAVARIRILLEEFGDVLDFPLRASPQSQTPRIDITICKPLNLLIDTTPNCRAGDVIRNDDLRDVRREIALRLAVRIRLGSHPAFEEFIEYIKNKDGRCNLTEFCGSRNSRDRDNMGKSIYRIMRIFGEIESRRKYAVTLIEEFLTEQAGVAVTLVREPLDSPPRSNLSKVGNKRGRPAGRPAEESAKSSKAVTREISEPALDPVLSQIAEKSAALSEASILLELHATRLLMRHGLPHKKINGHKSFGLQPNHGQRETSF